MSAPLTPEDIEAAYRAVGRTCPAAEASEIARRINAAGGDAERAADDAAYRGMNGVAMAIHSFADVRTWPERPNHWARCLESEALAMDRIATSHWAEADYRAKCCGAQTAAGSHDDAAMSRASAERFARMAISNIASAEAKRKQAAQLKRQTVVAS